MMRVPVLFLGAIAFATPHDAMGGNAGGITIIGGCGDPNLAVSISFDTPQQPEPTNHPCCDRLACHAATERSKKPKRP